MSLKVSLIEFCVTKILSLFLDRRAIESPLFLDVGIASRWFRLGSPKTSSSSWSGLCCSWLNASAVVVESATQIPVSYTHLDVYKRQFREREREREILSGDNIVI